MGQRQKKIAEDKEALHVLQSKIDLYSRVDEFIDYGFYEQPEYLFDTSERFALEIKNVRGQQKELIADDRAVVCPHGCVYDIDTSFIDKIIPLQKKLAIRTFNIECDFLMSKVNPGNFERTLRQIASIANSIEKEMADMRYGFNEQYVTLKMEECKLQYQFTLKKKEEIEEQRALKEQMREEERARREYEREIALAEKEEDTYHRMLKKAQEELAQAHDKDRQLAEMRIEQLQSQLAEAMSRAERAKSMAEQTKRGHVYIISNIGSFGENIYKIGLTRRLDPTERVKELSDASVPFAFDIHAMIASDDAPALEKELHMAFDGKRVNAVNLRKEFFHVQLNDIKNKAQQLTGRDNDFITTILANEYFQTKRLRSEH